MYPATAVATLDDLLAKLPLVEHPVAGLVREVPHPVRYADSPASVRRPAPTCGQNGVEVLAEIGYDTERIDQLRSSGVLG